MTVFKVMFTAFLVAMVGLYTLAGLGLAERVRNLFFREPLALHRDLLEGPQNSRILNRFCGPVFREQTPGFVSGK